MKKPFLCLFLLSLVSCSQQDDAAIEKNGAVIADPSTYLRTVADPAENSANPFDLAGKVHDELFQLYFAQPVAPFSITSMASQIETLASLNKNFQRLNGANVPRTTATKTQAYSGHEACGVADAITTSSLGVAAKASLTAFTSTILLMNSGTSDYDAFYTYIETYESGVLANSQFTAGEKERLLTVSSICRYSAYRGRKKPKKNDDPDWDYLVLSLAGSIDGAEQNTAESVVTSLTAGIFQNH